MAKAFDIGNVLPNPIPPRKRLTPTEAIERNMRNVGSDLTRATRRVMDQTVAMTPRNRH